jgi:aldehyde dehydrogenase (NAD+)
VNPHNEKLIVAVQEATEKDVDRAVAAARRAFNGFWRSVTPTERSCLLAKLAELIERDIDVIASIEALDNGKALSNARGDVSSSVGCLRYYAGWADKIFGQTIDVDPSTHAMSPSASAARSFPGTSHC